MLPNSFIVGVNKAGTTSIFNALAALPDVSASSKKETHFFDPLKYGEPLGGLADYEALFPPGAGSGCVLEATPGYFYGGEKLARAIDDCVPQGRHLIVLREPGQRAFSWWRFARSRLLVSQDLSFPAYLQECSNLGLAPESDRDLVGFRGLSGGHYSHWLPGWQRVLGDRLLVVFYDQVRDDFSGTVERIGAHFGIRATAPTAGRDNVSVDIANSRLQSAALAVNRAGERVWRRFPHAKRVLRSTYYRLNSRTVQTRLEAPERAWLDDYFRDSLDELAGLLPQLPAKWRGRAT